MGSFAERVADEGEFRRWVMHHFEASWRECSRCSLARSSERVVVGHGPLDPILMVVAEAPGETEDREGLPLVGESGRLFRAACAKVGLDLTRDAYLTNVCGCRPPGNRKPDKRERDACRPRLEGLARNLNPHVILLLGGTAMRWARVPRDSTVGSKRGLIPRAEWPNPMSAAGVPRSLKAVFLTWHPSHVIRQEKRVRKRTALAQMVQDLRSVERVVRHVGSRTERLFV